MSRAGAYRGAMQNAECRMQNEQSRGVSPRNCEEGLDVAG
jgi:hypothetical protein